MVKKRKSKKPDLTTSQHDKHGRATADNEPAEPDCECRDTDKEKTCALAGCGFCLASLENKTAKHCDDYADDPATPEALRVWLNRARMPGHGMHEKEPFPHCYADYEGKVVRLTMASRLGSVGWSSDLTQEVGYEHRGWLSNLSNFRDKPSRFKNREELKAYVMAILEKASEETKAKREAGICIERDCTKPALKDSSVHFFGDDSCEEHAMKAELECLIEDQQDDETDEAYLERTGEPRGAGADWAGREKGDFSE